MGTDTLTSEQLDIVLEEARKSYEYEVKTVMISTLSPPRHVYYRGYVNGVTATIAAMKRLNGSE